MPVKHTRKKQLINKGKVRNNKDIIYLGYAISVFLGILFYFYAKDFNFIQDDSYITYRYVKNFTEGNGLVFNIGERVEGYTNFLWVIILSFLKIAGFNFIVLSQALGIIAAILTIIFTFKISSEIFPKDIGTASSLLINTMGALVVTANGALAYWAVSGMETGLFTFLTTLSIYLYLKELKQNRNYFSSVVFLLSALTRPEGVLIFAITLAHKIYYLLKVKQNKPDVLFKGNNLKWLLAFFIPGIIYMFWRISYFGYLLPNTFYAKTGSSLEYIKTGFDYFIDFVKTYGFYGIALILAIYNLFVKELKAERTYLVLIVIFFILYIIIVGGDVLRPSRFFLPVVPVISILAVEGSIVLIRKFQKSPKAIIALPVIFFLIYSYLIYKIPLDNIKRYSELENGLTEKMKITSGWLKNKQIQEGRKLTVAASTIGAISYFSETTLIDMLGLTDKEVAHNPKPIPEISENADIGWKERHYNVDYILSRKPDYIYFSTGMKPSAYAERGLFTNEEFLRYYYAYYINLKEYGFTECLYKRKTEDQITTWKPVDNPNYKKSFVNLFNQAINTSRDKSKQNEAIDLFNKTLQIAPGNFSPPYQLIGEIYMQQKNTRKALEYFKKAADLDEFNIMAHLSLYQLYMSSNDTVNARQSFDKISQYDKELLGN